MRTPSSLVFLELATAEVEGERERRRMRPTLPGIVLVIGVVYFVWVALLGSNVIVLRGLEPTITVADWAQWGAGLMVVLLAALLVDYRRKGLRAEPTADVRAQVGPRPPNDEVVVTAEAWKGFRVLEYSRPPKSEHATAVYAKCHVGIDGQWVLRVEDLVADARE